MVLALMICPAETRLGNFHPPQPEGVAPLVWGLGCQELKHGANLFSSFYPLVRRWGGQAIGRADADRPHESGGGGPTDGLRPERIRHEVEPASIGDDLLIIVPHPCMRRILSDPDHDAVIRIGSEAPKQRWPILFPGMQAKGALRATATSDRSWRVAVNRGDTPNFDSPVCSIWFC